jgi:nucleolar protein 56
MYLITTWFGTFLLNETEIQRYILFPQDETKLLKRIQTIRKHQVLPEEKKIIKGAASLVVNEQRLRSLGDYCPFDPFFKTVSIDAKSFGFSSNLLHKVTAQLTAEQVDEQLRSPDLQVVQMVNALDDLIQTANLLSERIDRWSAIPTPPEKINPVEHTLASVTTAMKQLEHEIDADMHLIAPNIQSVVGSLIGARLISLAGGLQRLACMSASTIQILGAEQAFFRFKKEGGKPPKHGVIFQHPLINKSSRSCRGRVARVLAGKIALAAKADVFTKRDIADDLVKDLDARVKEIRNQ